MSDGGFVYFVQARHGGPIKIGYSGTIEGVAIRLRGLQIGNPAELVVRHIITVDGPSDEGKLHRELDEWRIRGEWFLPTREVLRRCDLMGRAKVGKNLISVHMVERREAKARLEGFHDATVLTRDYLDRLERQADETGGTFDADSLDAAIQGGRFLDTTPLDEGSGLA